MVIFDCVFVLILGPNAEILVIIPEVNITGRLLAIVFPEAVIFTIPFEVIVNVFWVYPKIPKDIVGIVILT